MSSTEPHQDEKKVCLNCNVTLKESGEYCYNCGQNQQTKKITFLYLLNDFINNVFNIDSKLFRTIGALLIPGKLTLDYFKGMHHRYASPSRIFFIAGIVHFAVISLVIGDKLDINLSGENGARETSYTKSLRNDLDSAKAVVLDQYGDNPDVLIALDTFFDVIALENNNLDSIHLSYLSFTKKDNFSIKSIALSYEEIYTDDIDALSISRNITEKYDKLLFKQLIRVFSSSENFGAFIIGNLIWMVIFMMPGLAIALKILYIRSKKYYVEHLVFAFNYHAFAFWLTSIVLLVSYFTDHSTSNDSTTMFTILILTILVYLFLSMRKVYKQSFMKTFVKFVILNFSYLLIFAFSLILTLMIGMLFY